jgi:hypothetical protein
MKNDPLIKIKNIVKMSKHIGKDVAKNTGIPLNEMSYYIKPKEIRSIIKQYSINKHGDYMLNTLILQKVYQEVNNWVLGIQLSKMASQGQLEAFWDSETNSMTFNTIEGKNNG